MKRATKLLSKAARLARKAARKLAKAEHKNTAPGAFVRVAQLPRESRLARARMRGWNDVVHGKGFRDSYDVWKKAAQLAYERGRQEATMAKGYALVRGKALDEWTMDEYVQGPMFRAVGADIGARIIDDLRKTVRSVK